MQFMPSGYHLPLGRERGDVCMCVCVGGCVCCMFLIASLSEVRHVEANRFVERHLFVPERA